MLSPSSLNTIAMLIAVFDLWILIDRYRLCVPTVHWGGTSRYNMCKNHSNTRSSCAITLKMKPTTMSWSRCWFKKKSRKLCITNKYKIHNKIYPIQHSAHSGKRCIEETNRDEYKNITTRNVFGVFFAVHHGHRGHYKPIATIRLLCPSWLSANYNRCP